MSRSEVNRFRKVLESRVIEFDRSTRRRDAIAVEKSADELESALQASQRELAVLTLESESARVREARAALRRIQDGSYGICVECDEKISPKRLAALPWAALCIRCQEAMDCHCGAKGPAGGICHGRVRPAVTGITPAAVRAQLEKILASEAFVRSRRMQRFLEFIVEETLAGRADELGEYGIGMAVFDRGPDFEPALDPIVRNDARRLRLKLLEYYRQASSDPVVIEMPKGGYVPIFLEPSSIDPPRNPPRRLAVLPFETLSTAPETALYGRALCMSLTANLTDVDGLEAIAHGYVAEQSPRLSHVIQGSVFTSGDRGRVTVNLICVPEGAQIWAREYDFATSEVLPVLSEIAASVLHEVKARLGLERPRRALLALAA